MRPLFQDWVHAVQNTWALPFLREGGMEPGVKPKGFCYQSTLTYGGSDPRRQSCRALTHLILFRHTYATDRRESFDRMSTINQSTPMSIVTVIIYWLLMDNRQNPLTVRGVKCLQRSTVKKYLWKNISSAFFEKSTLLENRGEGGGGKYPASAGGASTV